MTLECRVRRIVDLARSAPRLKIALATACVVMAMSSTHAESVPAGQPSGTTLTLEQTTRPADKASSPATAASVASVAIAGPVARKVWQPPPRWLLYLVPLLVLIASVLAIHRIAATLAASRWSLADALSEEVLMPAYVEADGFKTLQFNEKKEVVLIPELHASSSRMIAMMGMVSILLLFLGFGVFAIFEFGATGEVPDSMDRIGVFLTSGLTLFAPYLVNKFASVFKISAGSK